MEVEEGGSGTRRENSRLDVSMSLLFEREDSLIEEDALILLRKHLHQRLHKVLYESKKMKGRRQGAGHRQLEDASEEKKAPSQRAKG